MKISDNNLKSSNNNLAVKNIHDKDHELFLSHCLHSLSLQL